MIKKYLKSYLYLFGLILVLTIIISIISYLSGNNLTILKYITPIISIFVGSFILGRNTKEKAYLEGIKFAIPYILLTIIINIIFKSGFNIKTIVLYLLLVISSIIGATLGINLKKS